MFELKSEWKPLLWLSAAFLILFFLPVGTPRFDGAINEALQLAKWYAQEHVILCLLPAFFIAGGISVFISQASVMRYLGPNANRFLSYGVASVSGSVLAVCSCTVLPLFSGIYRMGAGLGPASAFLYAGPAINVLAIILTARILGPELGIARAVGAVVFSIVIGLLMHLIFRKEEQERINAAPLPDEAPARPLWQTALWFGAMIGVLVSATWGTAAGDTGLWNLIYGVKWYLTGLFAVALAIMLTAWMKMPAWKVAAAALPPVLLALFFPAIPLLAFSAGLLGIAIITATDAGESGEWFSSTWGFTKQIAPLLLGGVLVAGFLLGRPGHEGLMPSAWVSAAVGGNSLLANFTASVLGAFMYFATLTEVPILQGLIGSGMGKGPALALLLAGPALSLPSMLVIRSIMGTKKTAVFVTLVVIMATASGWLFGLLY